MYVCMYVPKIVGNLLDSHLEIFSLPQGIENSRQFLLLRTDSLQKTVVGCPCCDCRFLEEHALPLAISTEENYSVVVPRAHFSLLVTRPLQTKARRRKERNDSALSQRSRTSKTSAVSSKLGK